MKSKLFKILFAVIVLSLFGHGILTLYGNHQQSKLSAMSFAEALTYTTKNTPDAVLTVGIIKDGHATYNVYGENAKTLPQKQHTYEIGSITKTFTAALVNKAVKENLIDLDDPIDYYLPLPEKNTYPTVKELLTHTAGYKNHYIEHPMASNFLTGRNSFYSINKEMIRHKAGTLNMNETEYPFVYSNFGYALLGLVLESVYKKDYPTLMNDYILQDLDLHNTKISDGQGDLQNYWAWQKDDAYIPAGAITSTIDDMLAYAAMQLENDSPFSDCHHELKAIPKTPKKYTNMNIHTDAIGYSWIIDKENNIVWHNGGTSDFNSYIGFDPDTKTAVVVLSNLPPRHRIPATILGIKLLNELRT